MILKSGQSWETTSSWKELQRTGQLGEPSLVYTFYLRRGRQKKKSYLHRPLVFIQLCLALSPSSCSCNWSPLFIFRSSDSFFRCSHGRRLPARPCGVLCSACLVMLSAFVREWNNRYIKILQLCYTRYMTILLRGLLLRLIQKLWTVVLKLTVEAWTKRCWIC